MIKFTNLNMSSQIVFLRPKIQTWGDENPEITRIYSRLKSFSSACLVGGLSPKWQKNQVNQVAKSEHLIRFAKFHRGVKIQINQDRPRSIPCFGAYICKHRCHNEVLFISAEHSTRQFALKQALASAAPVLQQSSTKPLIRIRISREVVRLKPTSQQKAQV